MLVPLDVTHPRAKRLYVNGISLLIAACSISAVPGSDEPTAGELARAVSAVKFEHGVPALAVGVVRGDRIVATPVEGIRAYGANEPIRTSDRFHIASCTKSMTAMLAAMLVEEGKLRWDSTVGDVLPELKAETKGQRSSGALAGTVREEYPRVQLVQLLSHTGGLPEYTNFGPDRLAELVAIPGTHTEQRLRFVQDVLSEQPVAAPGTRAVYSNAGYALVGAMIERAAGVPWEETVRQRIFEPLQMQSAGFGWPATPDRPDQPHGHRPGASSHEWIPQPIDDPYRLPPCLWPAGAVHCSIEDLARYVREHLNGLGGRGKLLRPETYQRLHSTWDGKPEGFTLGGGRNVDETFGPIHYGAGSGGTFFVRIWIAPQADLAIVAATNCGSSAVTSGTVERISQCYRGR